MAPILYALLLLAQDAPAAAAPAASDGPVATQVPRKQDVAPLPIQGGPVTPPSDDYGYVGWCFGAVSGYVELYDKAMPEVIRIERAWPTPSTEENIKEIYPAQKKDAIKSLELFKRAIEATEKASPTPISTQGAAAIKKGRGVWTGATSVPKAQLAQFWMSWAPPAKCDETAKALEARSTLFGQALTYNAAPPAPAPATPEVAPEAPADPVALVESAPAAPPAEVAEVEASIDTPTPAADAPVAEEAAPPAPALDPADIDATETASAGTEDAAPSDSAIDALLPAADAPEAAAEPEPEPEPEAAPPPVAAKPAPVAAKPAPAKPKPAKKPGLRDTLKGMRGPL